MKLYKSTIQYLIYSNVLVSLCAVSLSMVTELLLDTNHNMSIHIFIGLATFITYNLQRIIRYKNKDVTKRAMWMKKNYTINITTIIIALIICSYIFFKFNINTKLLVIFCGLLCLAYPIFLRNIPYIKIFLITTVWSISTVLFIVTENNLELNGEIIHIILSRFFFIIAITIPFDIRDIKIDNKEMKTIPIIFKEKTAVSIAISCLFAFESISIIQYLLNEIHYSLLIGITLSFLYSLFIVKESNSKKPDIYFSLWVESSSLFLYLFLLICTLMF